jgi:hypothetical protein
MSQPAHKIRISNLSVTIWRNLSEKGTWYSVTPSRSYKQGDETWKGNRQSPIRRPADDGGAAPASVLLGRQASAGGFQGP